MFKMHLSETVVTLTPRFYKHITTSCFRCNLCNENLKLSFSFFLQSIGFKVACSLLTKFACSMIKPRIVLYSPQLHSNFQGVIVTFRYRITSFLGLLTQNLGSFLLMKKSSFYPQSGVKITPKWGLFLFLIHRLFLLFLELL